MKQMAPPDTLSSRPSRRDDRESDRVQSAPDGTGRPHTLLEAIRCTLRHLRRPIGEPTPVLNNNQHPPSGGHGNPTVGTTALAVRLDSRAERTTIGAAE